MFKHYLVFLKQISSQIFDFKIRILTLMLECWEKLIKICWKHTFLQIEQNIFYFAETTRSSFKVFRGFSQFWLFILIYLALLAHFQLLNLYYFNWNDSGNIQALFSCSNFTFKTKYIHKLCIKTLLKRFPNIY